MSIDLTWINKYDGESMKLNEIPIGHFTNMEVYSYEGHGD
jgi:hypothetical protein